MEAPWQIELLGWLRATQGEQVVTRFRSQKTGALLAYLAYHAHRSHPREALIELHWPECDPEVGRQRLRTALTSLRHQLEPPGVSAGAVILADSAAVQLNPAACGTDVAQFEARLRSAAAAGSGAERVQRLTDAVALYRGELLPGYYESWILPERERLAEIFFQALGQLIAHAEQAGDLDRALQWARRAVSADPLREAAHRDLMRLLAATGERDAALRQYRELARRLDEELGAEPEEETRALARSLPSQTGDGRRQTVPIQEPFAAPAASETCHISPPVSPSRALAPQSLVISLPTGTVTFVLAEIAGAAALRERGEAAFAAALESCQELLRPLFRGHGGHEVDAAGEVLRVAFGRASDALAAAVAGQRALAAHPGPVDTGPLCVRMALHTGEVEPGEEVRGSPVLAHASRLLLAAHGGQILVSAESAALLGRDLAPGLELADLGLYRLREEAPPERLFQARSPEMLPRAFPAPNAPAGHGGNLPLQFTRFFGRQEEIAQLCELLAEGTRLVTLTGPGGSGKTRLALEAAQRWVETWRGAVWCVSLADLVDPRLIADAVLTALRLPRSPSLEPLEQTIAALSRQPTLLLLDNLEHLLPEGAALVGTLRERVPTLTCVVTSRQRLDLAGEREFLVLPLPTPDARDTPEQLIQCASVQLFVDRAQGVRPDFQVTRANAPAVAALCQRLEGIPLALELAAARAGVLTPQQMLERLSQRFELLARPQRGTVPRHRSLWAALGWSFRLLPAELQRCFARLSVFQGGWTLEAAAAVAGSERKELGETLTLQYLEQLRECSLVQTEEAREEMRYRLLETLREYGAEQLGLEEREALGRRHARYYMTFVEAADPGLLGPELDVWLGRLKAERDNMRAALAWAVAHQETETALRLGGTLRQFWAMESTIAEGRSWLEASLQLPGASLRTAPRAKALCSLGQMAWMQGDFDAARAALHESLAIWRERGDKVQQAFTLTVLGWVEDEGGGHLAAARAAREESLALFREAGHRWGIAHATVCLGRSALVEKEYETARRLNEEAAALFRAQGDPFRLALPVIGLGNVALAQGDYAAARRYYTDCLAIRERYASFSSAMANVLGNLAFTEWCLGDWQAAMARLEACIELRRKGDKPQFMAWNLLWLGRVAQCAGQPQRAGEPLRESLDLFRKYADRKGEAQALIALGRLAREEQRPAEAPRLLREGLTLAQAVSDQSTVATGLVETAALLADRNNSREWEQAARLLGAAAAILQAGGGPVPPYESARLDQQRSAVRGALGDTAFRAAGAAGQALTPEQAVAEAMQALVRAAPGAWRRREATGHGP